MQGHLRITSIVRTVERNRSVCVERERKRSIHLIPLLLPDEEQSHAGFHGNWTTQMHILREVGSGLLTHLIEWAESRPEPHRGFSRLHKPVLTGPQLSKQHSCPSVPGAPWYLEESLKPSLAWKSSSVIFCLEISCPI